MHTNKVWTHEEVCKQSKIDVHAPWIAIHSPINLHKAEHEDLLTFYLVCTWYSRPKMIKRKRYPLQNLPFKKYSRKVLCVFATAINLIKP